jgi:uncharacterized protein (TIGR02147 family)
MAISIYDYNDYREYLRQVIGQNKHIRGFQAQMAKAAPCQSSYLSQVLHSNVQLTPDQALGIANYCGLSELESDYFVNLVSLARATSSNYRSFILRRLKELKGKGRDFGSRVQSDVIPNGETDFTYYSAWYWIAIHMIVGIPRYQTVKSISERLRLSEPFIEGCLQKLRSLNLVQKKGNFWIRNLNNIHLSKNSPFVAVHHNNWRTKAAMNAVQGGEDSFHYSVVYTMSVEDFERVKSRLQDFIVETRKDIETSEDQELVAISLDCYRI